MTSIVLAKIAPGTLIAIDDEGCEYIEKMAQGSAIVCSVKKLNNPKFHRKLMALFKIGFDAWQPSEKTYKGHIIAKNYDRFRQDMTVLAGFYDIVINIDGELRREPMSLAFDKMDNDTREKLYSEVINVYLRKFFTDQTRESMDEWVERVLQFDGGRF